MLVGKRHHSYPGVYGFIRRMAVCWLKQRFRDCRRGVEWDSLDSTSIRVEIAQEQVFPERKVITIR